MLKLKATKREVGQDLETLRKSGYMPAVFYGFKQESTPISVLDKDFRKILNEAGESTAFILETENGPVDVLIHDVQVDPVKDHPVHADFLAIDTNKVVRINIPLEFVGVSIAVKTGLGVLVKVMHEIEIEALPKNLPHSIEVDISSLETLDSQVLVKDLKLPVGVESIAKEDEVVAAVAAQKEEKEEVAEPVDLTKIEVEKKGKKDLPAGAGEEGEGEAPAEAEKK